VKVPFRDRLLSLAAPFTGAPAEIGKTEFRFGGLAETDTGVALLTESDRNVAGHAHLDSRRTGSGAATAVVPQEPGRLQRSRQSGVEDPAGTWAHSERRSGFTCPEAARPRRAIGPFLDRLNLKTLATERLFRTDGPQL
jgi:hypothetical protein